MKNNRKSKIDNIHKSVYFRIVLLLLLGDFNGDGFGDVLCYTNDVFAPVNLYVTYSNPNSSSKGIFTTTRSQAFPWKRCKNLR